MNALFTSLILLTSILADKPIEANRGNVRTMPVARTPESNTIILKVAVPEEDQVVKGNPVWLQFRIDGYALGASSSQFDRASELVVSDKGQTVHVVIDDHPYFPINEPALDPFDEDGYYYDQTYKFEIPFRLKQGSHIIRIFPARSFGESLKNGNAFQAIQFYVGKPSDQLAIDLTQPYLTYNEPSNQMYLVEKKPILLDFLISNAELSADGYKVRLSIDGKVNRTLTSWQPYYIYGLKRGEHTIRLELLNENNKLVPGPFNDTEQTITIH